MSSETSARVTAFEYAARLLSSAVADLLSGPIENLDAARIDELVAATARVFTAAQEYAPAYGLNASSVSTTEALTLASSLLRAHNINAFDLALWLAHLGTDGTGMLMSSTAEENR